MILKLAREQMRAQKAYVLWTAVLLVAATTLLTYAWTFQSTNAEQYTYSAEALGETGQFGAEVLLTDYSGELAVQDSGFDAAMTSSELRSVLDQANANGAGAVARVWVGEFLVGPEQGATTIPAAGWAVSGAVDWNALLIEGVPPTNGEIALAARVASAMGVGVGSEVFLGDANTGDGSDSSSGAEPSRLRVSGITFDDGRWASPSVGGEYSTMLVAIDDGPSLPGLGDADGLDPRWVQTGAGVSWSEPSAVMDAAFPEQWPQHVFVPDSAKRFEPLILALALSIGLVVMAFAVGRAQAQTRVQWVATARALGASRRAIVASTLLEGALVGTLAWVVGMGVGYGAAAFGYARYQGGAVAPVPVDLTLYAGWIPWIGLSAMGLGLVVAVVPAVISARAAPSAALKSVPSVDESTVSREVRVWPLVVILAASYVALLATVGSDWYILDIVAGVAALVAAIALMVEASRRIARALAMRLSRSRSPALIKAGLDLGGHPRQAAALVTLQALAGVTLTSVTIASSTLGGELPLYSWSTGLEAAAAVVQRYPAGMAIAGMVIVAVLCGATFEGTRALGRPESAVSGALGLTPSDARRADVVRFGAPQLLGVGIGALAGFVLTFPVVWIEVLDSASSGFTTDTQAWAMSAAAIATVLTLVLQATTVAAATGVMAAASYSRARRDRVPVDA